MKKLAHLLGYLLRRQLLWVILFWALVASFVALIHSELLSAIIIGALGLTALIIVIRIHDHLDGGNREGFLRVRPVGKNRLIMAELVFLFCVIVLPMALGILTILISYEAKAASYAATLIWLVFVTSQLAIWYVAAKLSRSILGTLILVVLCYLPVAFLWAVVEYRNVHALYKITVFTVLILMGFLSLSLVFLPLAHGIKKALFTGSAGLLLLAMSGIRWDRTEPGHFGPLSSSSEFQEGLSTQDEAISVEFAAAPLFGADDRKDSHWDHYKISTNRPEEIFIPTNVLGSPFTNARSSMYRYYQLEQVDGIMLGDLVLRNLPPGTDLRGTQPLSYNLRELVGEKPKTIQVEKKQKSFVVGQKHHLRRLGRLPLKKGASNKAQGYRVAIKEAEMRATMLSLKVEIGWVFDSLWRTEAKSVRTVWVLYSPSSQRGVLLPAGTTFWYGNFKPTLIATYREHLEFPLPETFADTDDVELHAFLLEEGESFSFEVTIPPGEYSAQ